MTTTVAERRSTLPAIYSFSKSHPPATSVPILISVLVRVVALPVASFLYIPPWAVATRLSQGHSPPRKLTETLSSQLLITIVFIVIIKSTLIATIILLLVILPDISSSKIDIADLSLSVIPLVRIKATIGLNILMCHTLHIVS